MNRMKNRIKVSLSATLAAAVLTFVPVIALAEEANDSTTDGPTTSTTQNEPNDTASLQDRLQKRKTDFQTRLTNVQETRLKARCKASQTGAVKALAGRVRGLETSRHNVYENLVSRLENASGRLETAGLDVTTLNAQIDTLKTKIATFETDLAAYKQAVSDLRDMDCVADPAGFQASLEAARAAREKVVQDAADIKAYVNDTIKPTLVDLSNQLKSLAENQESTEAE